MYMEKHLKYVLYHQISDVVGSVYVIPKQH